MRRLWYDHSAANWNEALPLGNGFMGAMVYGGTAIEQYVLNEDSLWYGGFTDRVNPDAKENMPVIQKLLKEDKIIEAQRLAELTFPGTPESERHYEPLCDLIIQQECGYDLQSLHGMGWLADRDTTAFEVPCEDYIRELDLDNGIHTVKYQIDEKKYSRESFISYPKRVMAIDFEGEPCRILLKRGKYYKEIKKIDDRTLGIFGKTGDDGVSYCAMCRTVADDVKIIGSTILAPAKFKLFVAAATTFRYEDPQKQVLEWLDKAESFGYENLKEEHISDFSALMSRCSLDLESTDTSCVNKPTDVRLKEISEKEDDLDLINDYFSYGRYLLISSSRQRSLPANLQGIWNKDFLPPWDSKYTININTQMNYWPAEILNLSELHGPLFDLLNRMLPRGQQVAKEMYGARGFVAHHNTDLWGDCAPQDIYGASTYWHMGAAWLCLHIAEHYFYTKDKEFLKANYKLMEEAALFLIDTMVENKDGVLTVSPSVSPENTYLTRDGVMGTLTDCAAMDSQIVYELFKDMCICGEEIGANVDGYRKIMKKLTPVVVEKGLIKEWLRDYDEVDPGHRHISHLFSLYPGTLIDSNDESVCGAARDTLERRLSNGGGHTGWSRAWIICMWARLLNGDEAWNNIKALLVKSTLPNMFDNHPPFQIDGNFGSVAGIGEMLIQSHNGELCLLPAKPKVWKKGKVSGLRARGGYTVDISWNESEYAANITADNAGILRLSDGKIIEHGKGQCITIKAEI